MKNANLLLAISATVITSAISAFAANTFRVTPYVQHPATNAMSILWFSEQTGNATLKWWRADADEATASSVSVPGTAAPALAVEVNHTVLPTQYKYNHRITGLEPDTAYRYKVTLPGEDGAVYTKSFRTAPAAFRPVRFVAYADSETQTAAKTGAWEDPLVDQDDGSKTGSRKYYVAKEEGFASNVCAMASISPDFVVIAGDLAGDGSTQNHWDQYWKHYAGSLSDCAGTTPLMAAPGNHDYSSYDAKGDFGEIGMGKYLTYFEYEPNTANVDPDQKQRFHRLDYGPVAIIFIDPNNGPNYDPANTYDKWANEYAKPNDRDTNQCMTEDVCRAPDFNPGSEQYKWVEEQLADAQTNKLFTFLVCHQCPYSIGYHGRRNGETGLIGGEGEYLSGVPTRCYTNLVFKYGVDAWICGHDEICEHSRLTGTEIRPDSTTTNTEIHVYDVGYGGDDLRGARRTSEPNPYEVFRAHVDAPEVYGPGGDHTTGVGLVSGGKHYGHLEVNVTTNEVGQWICTLQQNYVFITKDSQGNLSFENRTYPDVVTLTNRFFQSAEPEPPSASVKKWVGGNGNNLASVAANWDPVGVPETGDAIVLDNSSAENMTWDAVMNGIKPASWTQNGYTGTVTFGTTFGDSMPVVEITGNVVLNSGTWTHRSNGGAKNYRLYVKSGGDFTLGAGGTVSADALGYGTQIANIYGLAWQTGDTQGGSYGGHGGMATATRNFTYGCYYAPEDLGNAGKWMNTLTGAGAIRLDVGGAFVHNGALTATSSGTTCGGNYSGAGGSIFVNAASISGTGTMKADAGNVNMAGGGGRIAIILSGNGADFSNYDVLNKCEAISLKKADNAGGPGTIYCETAADTPHKGWMILKGNGTETSAKKLNLADPFTYQYTDLNFAKLTVTNATMLRIGSGYTLNLENTELNIASGCGIAIDGGTLTCGDNVVWQPNYKVYLYDTGTYPEVNAGASSTFKAFAAQTIPAGFTTAGKFYSNYAVTFTENATLKNGAVMARTDAATSGALTLTFAKNLTIEQGGKISADGKGYGTGKCPEGSLDNGWGGAHGGMALNTAGALSTKMFTYDSIINPAKSGSGGSNSGVNSSAGGGIIDLTVAGTLTLDGAITSDTGSANYYPGAGGAIKISAGELLGAGVVSANSGPSGNQKSTGAGGRIAVRLTGTGKDFSDYTGQFQAYGTSNDKSGGLQGGAGTIWLKTAAQAETEGTLIIANKESSTRAAGGPTPLKIDADNQALAFGDVIIGPKAKVTLADSTTLTVSGNFINNGSFTAGANSIVSFVGSGDAMIAGNTTFDTISCLVPGKHLSVTNGTTIKVTNLANFAGDANNRLVIDETPADGTWTFDTTGATVSFADVNVGGCQSVEEITVQGGTDLLGNNNVIFVNVQPTTLTWNGSVNTSWAEAGNWSVAEGDARAPLSIDTVIVNGGAPRNPVLSADASCAALTIGSGASLDLAGHDLTVSGNLTASGALTAGGANLITVGGNVALPGAFTRGNSVIILNGEELQTVSTASPLYEIKFVNGNYTVSSSLTTVKFTVGGEDETVTVNFANGVDIEANVFKVIGDLTDAPVTLSSSDANGEWTLLAYSSDVTGAKVKNCDASAGLPVIPSASTDLGGNVNWIFNDTRTVWDGTTELAEGADVVLAADAVATISSDIELGSIELRSGSKLTISANVSVEENVLVGNDATLVWNRPGTIGGQLVALDGAVITHDRNGSSEVNKIDLTVTGGGYIDAGAKIDINEKGHSPGNGPGGTTLNTAASYGGRGYNGNQDQIACYGSFMCPTNIGSGALRTDYNGTSAYGGGAVIMKFGGDLTLDGNVTANGGSGGYYTGSGGSVFFTANALRGNGSIQARGGNGNAAEFGGGGRIALVLTGAGEDFAEYTGSVDAFGGKIDLFQQGSSGTIFRKTAATVGELEIRGNSVSSFRSEADATEFPATKYCEPGEGAGVDIVVGENSTLYLTQDMKINTLSVSGNNAKVKLNGHVLTVSKPPKKDVRDNIENSHTTFGGGSYNWMKPGTILGLR